jgi:hypothetical protein
MPLSRINTASIANNTIIGADILANTITGDKMTANSISSNNIVSVLGSAITANTVANSAFQTGSVESYMRAVNLDFGLRNRIINGAMRIDQRSNGASFTATTSAPYTLDRWYAFGSVDSKFTVQQDLSANTVAGFTSSLKVTSSSAYSVGSAEQYNVAQVIEGFNIADLGWGTANARPITLSFWVRSSLTGTFGGSLRNVGTAYSYPFTYTINSANTWEYETITIPGPTSGTWGSTNGVGTYVNFSMGAGSTLSGTAGSWSVNNYTSATGATSVVGTNGATWYVTGVQFEEGSQPTPFEYRQYGTELDLCQRYYQVLPFGAGYIATGGAIGSNAVRGVLIKLNQVMRIAPTVTLPATGTGSGQMCFTSATGGNPTTVGTNSIQRAQVDSFQIEGDAYTSSFTSGDGICLTIGSGGASIRVSSEL